MERQRTARHTIGLWVTIGLLLAALVGLAFYTLKTADRMQGTITKLESDLARQKTVANGSVDELEQLKAQVSEQQATIEQQKGTIEEQKGTIKEQEETIKDRDTTIKEKQDKIDEQQGTIDEKQGEIDELKMQIALKNGQYSDYKDQKIVALTFDDGPGPYTERLLDALKDKGARATFFVLGTRVTSYPNLIRRMVEDGHIVGNHSNAHNMLHKMDLSGVYKEMGQCAEKIEKILGCLPPVMRCPGGNSSNVVKQYAKEVGIPIINWSVDTRDWESRNKEAILKVCKQNIKDGSIVLLHDIHKVSVDATLELLDWLEQEGYTMVTVPELLHARRGGMEAGKTYS